MQSWDEYNGFDPDDNNIDFYADGKWYHLDEETTANEATAALRASSKVSALIHNNSEDTWVYNGWIFFDENSGIWTATIDEPDGWQDYEFKNVNGTMVEQVAGDA